MAKKSFNYWWGTLASNTKRQYEGSQKSFAKYLEADPCDVLPHSNLWSHINHQVIEGYRDWLISMGKKRNTVAPRLNHIKQLAEYAWLAHILGESEYNAIRTISIDMQHDQKLPIYISDSDANCLKQQPDTPIGKRDKLLMCLLLDHGFRCGEIARLRVTDVDLISGDLLVYRPKVNITQRHKMSPDTLQIMNDWFNLDYASQSGKLLRKGKRGGELAGNGMSERAITARVKYLGEKIGLENLKAHDCRHYWADYHRRNGTDLLRLQEAGGWKSLDGVRHYTQWSDIANEGMWDDWE